MRDIFAIEFHGGQSVAITAASKNAVAIEVANPRASSFAPGAYTRAAVTNQVPAAVVNLNVAVFDGVYFVAVTTNASGSTYTLTVTQVGLRPICSGGQAARRRTRRPRFAVLGCSS